MIMVATDVGEALAQGHRDILSAVKDHDEITFSLASTMMSGPANPVTLLRSMRKLSRTIEGHCGQRIADVLLWKPRRIVDRRRLMVIADLKRLLVPGLMIFPLAPVTTNHASNALQPDSQDGAMPEGLHLNQPVSVIATVRGLRTSFRRRRMTVVDIVDETGEAEVVFFHASSRSLEQRFPIGKQVFVHGVPKWRRGAGVSFVHPEHVRPLARSSPMNFLPQMEPIYPLCRGLSNAQLWRYITVLWGVLKKECPSLFDPRSDWISAEIRQSHRWPTFAQALSLLHCLGEQQLQQRVSAHQVRERLAVDELLAYVTARRVLRSQSWRRSGISMVAGSFARAQTEQIPDLLEVPCDDPVPVERWVSTYLESLPFGLTQEQQLSLKQVVEDMEQKQRMHRVLQGDVGTGKTIVAVAAMVQAAAAGYQSALMAPTELLARQHYQTVCHAAKVLGLRVVLALGSGRNRAQNRIREEIRTGLTHLVVGTHALIQEGTSFARLGLVIVDEQHRFGVNQRASLAGKGMNPDVLMLTATPIPRTMLMIAGDDVSVSVLREKPLTSMPVKTAVLPLKRIDDVIRRLCHQLDQGGRAYWVVPTIEPMIECVDGENRGETESVALASIEERQTTLIEALGEKRVLVAHGRMPGDQIHTAFTQLRNQPGCVLLATTVVEVGVDAPEVDTMIIENAESFGLSQLHQLRGRIGRGNKPGHCVLLCRMPLVDTALERIQAIRQTVDGFVLADLDAQTRGFGDETGTRQSGDSVFRFVLDVGLSDAAKLIDEIGDQVLTSSLAILRGRKCAQSVNNPSDERQHRRLADLLAIFGYNLDDARES